MADKVLLEHEEIDYRDGYNLKEELNETLDSGMVQFLHENGESEIEPFDGIVFKKDIVRNGLPNEYQAVDYIESDGTAFIDTGITETSDLTVDCFMAGLEASNDYWFGGRQDANSMLNNGVYYYNRIEFNYKSINFAEFAPSYSLCINEIYRENGSIEVYINGHKVAVDTPNVTTSSHFFIFGCQYSNGNNRPYPEVLKLFRFDIFKAGVLVKHFIPCYRKSDNAVGLYDTVGKTFYTSMGLSYHSKTERKKLLIDSYTGEIENFKKDNLFESDFFYTSNLFSETKKLERITLPNLSITARPSGTQRSVASYIIQYLREYAPRIKVYMYSSTESHKKNTLKPSICYDFSINSKFNMPCPEFVWNTPTLKEVLTDLMSVADCIPVIKDNVLTYFDLSKKGKPIDTSKLTDYRPSGSSADYCDTLTLPMKNVLSKQPIIVNELLLPHSTSGEMTSNNAVYLTKKPIYKIKSAHLFVYGTQIDVIGDGESSITKLFDVDISNSIVEKDKSLLLKNGGWIRNKNDIRQDICGNLWFERGKNEIHNIGETYKRKNNYGVYLTHSTFAYIAALAVPENNNFGYNIRRFDDYSYAYDAPILQLEYETFGEETIKVSKEDKIKHPQNEIFDTQSANSVDLEHQTIFEYAKANRLASKIVEIYGEYEDESELPQLSDYIGNKILFSREMTFYKDGGIFFKGLLCENYILKDYFTGINSKERSWNIADTSEAILRNDVERIYAVFSKDVYQYRFMEVNARNETLYHSIFDFTALFDCQFSNIKGIKGVMAKSSVATTTFYLDLMTTTDSKAVKLFVSFNDNMKVGDQVVKDDDIYTMSPLSYVNSNGEAETIDYMFATYFEPLIDRDFTWYDAILKLSDPETFSEGELNQILETARAFPVRTAPTANYFQITSNHKKDNREIPALTLQVEYMSRENDVIVYDDIAKIMPIGNRELNPVDAEGDWADNIGAKYIQGASYSKEDINAYGTECTPTITFYYSDTGTPKRMYGSISVDATINEHDSWCLYSKITGKILLAVNNFENSVNTKVYFGIDTCKDEKIYNNQLDQKVIGTVFDKGYKIEANYEASPQEVSEITLFDRHIPATAIVKDF